MRIDNYKQFNEKLGIPENMEKQVDEFMKEINDNPTKNSFNFSYDRDGVKTPFKVKIDSKLSSQGRFLLNTVTLVGTIVLRKRDDISSLLHELKHLDYSLLKNKFSKYNNSYNDIRSLVKPKYDKIKLLSYIFYYYDGDEFQAQYLSMYKTFDLLLENIVSNMDKKDITYNFIKKEFENYLLKEYSLMFKLFSIKDFKFDTYFEKDTINNALSLIVDNDDINMDFTNDSKITLIYKILKNTFKNYADKIFKRIPENKIKKIEKLTKYFEKDINKKNVKYIRKIYRIVTLMYDKYN